MTDEYGACTHEQIVAVLGEADGLMGYWTFVQCLNFADLRHARRVVGSSMRERRDGELRTPNTQRTNLILRGCNLTVSARVIYKGITEMAARLREEWLSRHLQKVSLVAAAVALVGNCG